MKKAFDNINRECLWFKLQKCGIKGNMLNSIKSLYENVTYAVKVNGRLTPWFSASKGAKQGCNLSPTLFQIYINDLIEEVKSLGHGIKCGEKTVSILVFADDIALIARNEQELQ